MIGTTESIKLQEPEGIQEPKGELGTMGTRKKHMNQREPRKPQEPKEK